MDLIWCTQLLSLSFYSKRSTALASQVNFIHQHLPDKGDGLNGRSFFLDSQKPDRPIPEPPPAAASRVSHRYAWKGNLPSQSLFTVSCWNSPCNWWPLDWRWKAILALTTSLPGTFSPNWSCRVQTGSDPGRRSQRCAWEKHLCIKRTGAGT